MNRVVLTLVALGLSLFTGRVFGQSPDDHFIRVYNLIQQADLLQEHGQARAAQEKYLEAQTSLENLAARYPKWNEKIVVYRKRYIAEHLSALGVAAPPAAGVSTTPAGTQPGPGTAPVQPDERDTRISALNEQVKGLRSEREILQAKLHEALSAQPAATDPRELARSETRVKDLEKENELLRVNFGQQQEKLAQAVDPATLAEAERALREARKDLERQAIAVTTLSRDKAALEQKLKRQTDQAEAKAQRLAQRQQIQNDPQNAKALAEANAQVADLRQQLQHSEQEMASAKSKAEVLVAEKATLEQRVLELGRELAAKTGGSTSLATAAPQPVSKPSEARTSEKTKIKRLERERDLLRQDIAQLRRQVNDYSAEKARADALQAQTLALEKQVADLSTRREVPAAASNQTAEQIATERQRRQQAEKERDDLRQQVVALTRQLDDRRASQNPKSSEELTKKLETLQARLETYEARQVPYTSEELALMKATTSVAPTTIARTQTRTTTQPTPTTQATVRELPGGASQLVAEAQRAIRGGKLDEAEQKYQEARKLDQNNIPLILNVAAAQLEQDRVPEAEKTVNEARALAPDDPQVLSLLGLLRLRQNQYEEALDTLSRAAKMDGENALTQNYLGIALSHQGQRGPAETAFRRAVQLQPAYGEAHNNLAVVYATQKPPFLELARWHYQKALASGHAKQAELERLLQNNRAESASGTQ